MFKKIILPLIILLTVSLSFTAPPVFADGGFQGRSACPTFLGMTSWDCGVDIHDEESLKSGVATIALNVLTDITVLAAYLVIGYVIYGGYQYIFAAGDPSKVATGKKALYHAFMGLAIVMSAHVIMSAIRMALIGNNAMQTSYLETVDANQVFLNSLQWVIAISGLVAAIFVVYGGISYVTSSGDANKLQKAKQMITYALIGLAIVALAEVITAFVSNMIREANQTSLLNETIISKEINYEK